MDKSGGNNLIRPLFVVLPPFVPLRITISPFVLCLIFGVVATSIGFLEREPLRSANAFGFTMLILMVFVFDGLKRATPDMLAELVVPMFALIAIGIFGMYIFSFIAGKLVGISQAMAFACSLTALYGFPADYVITKEDHDKFGKSMSRSLTSGKNTIFELIGNRRA